MIDRGGGDHLEVHVTDASLQRALADRPAPARERRARGRWSRRHHPRASDQDERSTRDVSYDDKIKEIIDESDVALFMKGTPDVDHVRQLRARARRAAPGRRARSRRSTCSSTCRSARTSRRPRLADDPAGLRQGRADRRRRHRRGARASRATSSRRSTEKLGDGTGTPRRAHDRARLAALGDSRGLRPRSDPCGMVVSEARVGEHGRAALAALAASACSTSSACVSGFTFAHRLLHACRRRRSRTSSG